jgi:hypothetical protein
MDAADRARASHKGRLRHLSSKFEPDKPVDREVYSGRVAHRASAVVCATPNLRCPIALARNLWQMGTWVPLASFSS